MSDGSEQIPTIANEADLHSPSDASPVPPSLTAPAHVPPQLCLPLPRPAYPISPHRRGPKPENPLYQTLVPAKRKTAKGKKYYQAGTCRSKSPRVRKRAARIKPLPDTPAVRELRDQMARVNAALVHAMKEKHGIIKQKEKCGRKAVYFPELPLKEVAALVKLKPESLNRTLRGHVIASVHTLMTLSDLTGMRMEQFTRLWELRQLVDKDVQAVWERRSLLIKEGLKNRMINYMTQGQKGWLNNPSANPALRYKAEQNDGMLPESQ